jgi:hypothetical protein
MLHRRCLLTSFQLLLSSSTTSLTSTTSDIISWLVSCSLLSSSGMMRPTCSRSCVPASPPLSAFRSCSPLSYSKLTFELRYIPSRPSLLQLSPAQPSRSPHTRSSSLSSSSRMERYDTASSCWLLLPDLIHNADGSFRPIHRRPLFPNTSPPASPERSSITAPSTRRSPMPLTPIESRSSLSRVRIGRYLARCVTKPSFSFDRFKPFHLAPHLEFDLRFLILLNRFRIGQEQRSPQSTSRYSTLSTDHQPY